MVATTALQATARRAEDSAAVDVPMAVEAAAITAEVGEDMRAVVVAATLVAEATEAAAIARSHRASAAGMNGNELL